MKDYSLYEIMTMPDPNFPLKMHITRVDRPGSIFPNHWHEHIELLYFIEGTSVVECSQNPIQVSPGDLVVVNSSELHQGECLSEASAHYCVIIDTSLLLGQTADACQTKYISPITQNFIRFQNKIPHNPAIMDCIHNIIREYEQQEVGFELEIKSSVFHLLVLLLRNHVEKTITLKEHDLRAKNMDRFSEIFQYIDANYTEKITIAQCARMLNITVSHFCHLFKLITGKSLSNYVNYLRLKKAETLLKNTDLNISEIALATGFNDIAYFTRLFRRYKDISPSRFRSTGTDSEATG